MLPIAPLLHMISGGNQFASGGMLLMALGVVGASLRKIPSQIGEWARSQFTIHVTVSDEVELHFYLRQWLGAKYPARKMRRLALLSEKTFSLSEGTHWFWHNRRPLFIHIEKAPLDKAVMTSVYSEKGPRRPETTTLWYPGRSRKYLEDIHAEIIALQKKEEAVGLALQIQDGCSWTRVPDCLSRELSSVILPVGVREALVRDIQVFLDSKDWYTTAGIPYHRGYLLHGLPGTGKSSLVEGLAHHFKRDVYLLHLASARDSDLPGLFSEVRPGSILLLEDVDCVESTASRTKKEAKNTPPSNLTLSGLLNVLDGLQAPSGVLYFLTTNHREKLDPALIRPGRVDVQVEFGAATAEQAEQLYRVFCPGATDAAQDFAAKAGGRTMAELQMALMEQRNMQLTEVV